jgi:hypothetical protein
LQPRRTARALRAGGGKLARDERILAACMIIGQLI